MNEGNMGTMMEDDNIIWERYWFGDVFMASCVINYTYENKSKVDVRY